jgi:large subunit ribosomal protein L21
MYAIVKTGGKQYRVEQGQSLLVERLPASSEGDTVALAPLLYVDGDSVVDGQDLAKVSVAARVLRHERGPKLRVVKFKPKRGYKRRTGHRQELTRLEVTEIKLAARKPRAKKAEAAPVEAAEAPAAEVAGAPEAGAAPKAEAAAKATRARTRKPAAPKAEAGPEAAAGPEAEPTAEPAAEPPASKEEDDNGA